MRLLRRIVCRIKGHAAEHRTIGRGKVTAHAVWCRRCDRVLGTWSDRPRHMSVPRG